MNRRTARMPFYVNGIFGDLDRLAAMAALQAGVQRPAEQQHLETRKNEYWPEAAQRHQSGDAEGYAARTDEE